MFVLLYLPENIEIHPGIPARLSFTFKFILFLAADKSINMLNFFPCSAPTVRHCIFVIDALSSNNQGADIG